MDEHAALSYLKEMSSDVREALLLDAGGTLLAATVEGEEAEALAERARSVLELAQAAAREREQPLRQLEVTTPDGEVFAYADGGRTLLVVTGRHALPALMFTDMRMTLRDLSPQAAT